jgi:hypothetical protein
MRIEKRHVEGPSGRDLPPRVFDVRQHCRQISRPQLDGILPAKHLRRAFVEKKSSSNSPA